MSWIADHYEKAALGGALLCTLGLAYGGWRSLSNVEDDFVSKVRGRGSNDSAVASADTVVNSISSLGLPRNWSQGEFQDRSVDLFVSIPLFVTATERTRPIDLLSDDPVHPPIPNRWWLENRIDPGFEDSPERDPDGDGFTNLEEFLAGTDPNDPKSHPPLIAKLKYVGEESVAWAIRPGHVDEGGKNTFRYQDNRQPGGNANNTGAANPVEPGGIFFESGAAAGRFRLLGHETREEFNERTNAKITRTFARIEDQRENKKGTIYEFPAPLSQANMQLWLQYDRTAVFTLEAIGRGGSEFRVEELTTFKLPPDGDGPDHKLLSVTPEEVVVEYTDADGNKRSVTIPKGSLPRM